MASRDSSRRFHFLKEIASGGFGSVYLAKVMHADGFSRLTAIKLLHQRWSENVEIAQRMRDEARLLGWLRHRNIVDVIDLTTIGGRVAVIMEYLEAIDFKGAINHIEDTGGKMPPRAALEATAFVASALDAAYNRPPYQGEKPLRVIHRDIKPSNIMVDESGTVKVLDFGVARADFDHRESHTQELQFGSVDYMPPERLFFEPETPFSDVYSLGATLYELLALEKLGKAKGRPEKHAQFLSDRMELLRERCDLPGLSGDATVEFVRSMCAYNQDQRPSAAETVQRCRALARGFEGEGLTEWAERIIPPLVKAFREAPREPNPLTDSILSEDSASFKAEDTYVEPAVGGVVLSAADPVPKKIPAVGESWANVRQAALNEMHGDPAAAFSDGPTVVQGDDEVEVIDESGAEATISGPAEPVPRLSPVGPSGLGPVHLNAPSGAALDAPSAPYVKKAPKKEETGPPASADPAARPPPDPIQAAAEALRPPPVSSEFGEESTAIGGPSAQRPPADPAPAPPPPPLPAPAPVRSALRELEPVPEESPAPSRSWMLPVLLFAGLFLVVGGIGAVVVGGAILSRGGEDPAVLPPVPEVAPVSTAPSLVAGGINVRSAAPDTARITLTCDGVEASGAEAVGLAASAATSCSVKVMLKDRTRLYAEISDVSAGEWRCFEGGSKECVR